MRCPFCATHDTRVIDSRLASDGDQVRRRRECVSCKERFTSYEMVELTFPKIIKRDGARESFDENKLRSGINRALEKRPVNSEDVEAAVNRIKKAITQNGDREIQADALGELVMTQLSALDHVAFVRFASVYRSFQDISEFTEVIESLQKNSD